MAVPVGICIWSRLVDKTFPYLDAVVAPFDSVWMPDHVQYGDAAVAEGWTLFAYALARYPHKLHGHDVLCNSFRNPAHLAKMAATAQVLSGGRVVLGIGAGWNEEEYRAYGWPFPSARVRIEQLAEAVQIIRAMWSGLPATFEGSYYRVVDAYCQPQPDPMPPIMIGGVGETYLLRAVAQYADWWNCLFAGSHLYQHKLDVLRAHCQAVGREFEEITQVLHLGIFIAETEAEIQRYQERAARPLGDNFMMGTPQQITEQLLDLVKIGAHRLTIHFSDAPQADGALLFAATVLPHLQDI